MKIKCSVKAVSRDTYVYPLKFQCRRLSHRYVTYVSMRVNRNLVHTVRRPIVIDFKYSIFNISVYSISNAKWPSIIIVTFIYHQWSKHRRVILYVILYILVDVYTIVILYIRQYACLYIEKNVKLIYSSILVSKHSNAKIFVKNYENNILSLGEMGK